MAAWQPSLLSTEQHEGSSSHACMRLPWHAVVKSATVLQAFTWNGFDDGTTWLGGLWAGKTTEQGDFATLVYRAQLYGFNAVRIPFRWAQHPPFQKVQQTELAMLCL